MKTTAIAILGAAIVTLFISLIYLKIGYDKKLVHNTKTEVTVKATNKEHEELKKDEQIKRDTANLSSRELDDELLKTCRDCDGEPVKRMPSQSAYPNLQKGRVIRGDESSGSDSEPNSPSTMFRSSEEVQNEDSEVTPFCTPEDIIWNNNDCGKYNGW